MPAQMSEQMSTVNFKRELAMSVEQAIAKITQTLQAEGFGILTRIDFHTRMKEKLGKDMKPLVILGACNPQLAFEAYSRNADVTSLLPCNAVVRELENGKVSVELAKPTAMMTMLGDKNLIALAADADQRMQKALDAI